MIVRFFQRFGRAYRARRAAMIRALDTMAEPERAVFDLNAVHELDYPTIAERLGISIEEVERRLVAALLHLQSEPWDYG